MREGEKVADLDATIKGLKCCTKKPYPKNREKWGVKKEPECDDCPNRYTGLCEYCLMRDALELLKDQQWYQIEKHQPPRNKAVLVYCPKMRNTYEAYLGEDGLWRYLAQGHRDLLIEVVKYWRFLPKPPKEGEQE